MARRPVIGREWQQRLLVTLGHTLTAYPLLGAPQIFNRARQDIDAVVCLSDHRTVTPA